MSIKLFLLLCVGVLFSQYTYCNENNSPLYPLDICSDGNNLYISNRGTKSVDIINITNSSVVNSLSFDQIPTGVACCDGNLYITTFESKGELFAYSVQTLEQIFRVETGHGATSPIINKGG